VDHESSHQAKGEVGEERWDELVENQSSHQVKGEVEEV